MDADKGEHTIAILADTDDAVAESNEDNNAFSGSIDVGNSQQGPNLSVSYFSYYADGDSIYYFVDVHNSGTTTVESFYVDLYMDLNSPPEVYQDGEDYVEVTGLEPGETEYADFEINDYCWLCYSYVFIDSYNHVEEIDEDDNIDGPLFVESENVGR
jgi:subtilase family serine protease